MFFQSWSYTGMKLAIRTISVYRSCDNSSCCCYHHTRTLLTSVVAARMLPGCGQGPFAGPFYSPGVPGRKLDDKDGPPPDVVDDMMITMPPCYRLCCQRRNNNKDNPCLGHGRVGPGPKRSHRLSHSLSSGDPTKYRQVLKTLLPDRPVAWVLQLYSYASTRYYGCLGCRTKTMP
jgi:hypothetical protein